MKSLLIKTILMLILIIPFIFTSFPSLSPSPSEPKDNEKIISFLSKTSFLQVFNITSIFDNFLLKKYEFTYFFIDENNNKVSLLQNNFSYNTKKFELNINKSIITFGLDGNVKKEDGAMFNFSLSVKPTENTDEIKCLVNGKSTFLLYTNVFYGVINLSTIASSRLDSIQMNLKDFLSGSIDKNSVKCLDNKGKDYGTVGYNGMLAIVNSNGNDYFEPFKSLLIKSIETDNFFNIFSPMQVTVSKSQKVNIQLKYQRYELLNESSNDYMIIYHIGNVDKPSVAFNFKYEYKDFNINQSDQQTFLSIGFLNELLSLKTNSNYTVHSKFIENDLFYLDLNIQTLGSFIPDVYNLYMLHHKVILTSQFSIRECNIIKSRREEGKLDLSVRNKFTVEVYLANTEDVIIVFNFNVRHRLAFVNVDDSNIFVNGESRFFNLELKSIEFEYVHVEKYDFDVIIRNVIKFFKPLIEKYFEKERFFLFQSPIEISKSIDFSQSLNFPLVVSGGVVINSILGVRRKK